MSFDPKGLAKFDFNGTGNTQVCTYYDKMSAEHPKCSYYKTASDICRGKSRLVNYIVDYGITKAWKSNLTSDSKATILEKIRHELVAADQKARKSSKIDRNTDCVFGNDIDQYHVTAFKNAGLNPSFYGGSIWWQGVWPNPVPVDPRNPVWNLWSVW